MKKIIYLLALFTFATNNISAQPKGYVAISGGIAVPMGKFGSTDMSDLESGYAKLGANFNLSCAYRLGENFGITAMINGRENPIDEDAMLRQLHSQIDYTAGNLSTTNFSIGDWLLGGYGSFAISKITSLETRVMAGISTVTSPEVAFNVHDQGITKWIKQTSGSAKSFAYLVGAGLKFNAGDHICFLTNVDFIGGKPEFSGIEVISSTGSSEFVKPFNQPINTINLSIGIGYSLK